MHSFFQRPLRTVIVAAGKNLPLQWGKTRGFVARLRQISAQKYTEKSIAKSEKFFNTLFIYIVLNFFCKTCLYLVVFQEDENNILGQLGLERKSAEICEKTFGF